jgi:hypothetical protein
MLADESSMVPVNCFSQLEQLATAFGALYEISLKMKTGIETEYSSLTQYF